MLVLGVLKVLLFAVVGFMGAYASFFIFRWWPTLYLDKRDIPKDEIRKVDFRIAVGSALVAASVTASILICG